jgi:aminopeptidase-like protein
MGQGTAELTGIAEGLADPGGWMLEQMRRMAPHPRSITGDGVRRTLADVATHVPLTIHEVPSGTPVLDWTVPLEWNARAAWLDDPAGRRVADLATDPLALLGYSVPTRAHVGLDELRRHLFTLPDHPDRVPYRTSYYAENWGFCLPDRVAAALPDGTYTVHIDTTLAAGSLTYGELELPATLKPAAGPAEVLITTHVCHPAMANDNLSGIAVATLLAMTLRARPRRYTYRFLFIPGTIGSITWLARNRDAAARVHAGLVLTGLGDRRGLTYKRSRRGDTATDRAVELVLAEADAGDAPPCWGPSRTVDYSPYGYDERQFCSPGFDLPVGRLGRGQHGEYSEYHTSADDLTFVDAASLTGSYRTLTDVVDVLERNRTWRNLEPYGEPQLGRRGLYRTVGSVMNSRAVEMGLLWVLSFSDGSHDLVDIARRSGLPFAVLADAADALAAAGLLDEVTDLGEQAAVSA